MSDQKVTHSSSIGFSGLLTLIFITLKLTQVIDWSWWWVLSPIWITIGLVLSVAGISLLVLGAIAAWAFFQKK